MRIADFTKPDLDRFREQCNFTDIERSCFELKARDKTNVQLAMELNISESTVSKTMRRVRTKITRILEWEV